MDHISISLAKNLIFAYAIIIGILIGFYLTLLSKFQEYIALKLNQNIWFKLKEVFFRVILAIVSIYAVFILPMELLRYFITNPNHVKNLYHLYFYSVICSGIVSTLILTRLGKITFKRKP